MVVLQSVWRGSRMAVQHDWSSRDALHVPVSWRCVRIPSSTAGGADAAPSRTSLPSALSLRCSSAFFPRKSDLTSTFAARDMPEEDDGFVSNDVGDRARTATQPAPALGRPSP